MAINPRIPLQVQTPRIGEGIVQLANIKQQAQDRRADQRSQNLNDQARRSQAEAAEMQVDQAQLEAAIKDAHVVLPHLESGNIDQARETLNILQQVRGNAPHIQEALQGLEENPQAVTEAAQSLVQAGMSQGLIEEPEGRKFGRVISFDDPLNQEFGLGIPEGESARVEFHLDGRGQVQNADVRGRFATSNAGEVQTLSTQEKQELGLPQESVVQKGPDGKLNIVFEPERNQDQRDRKIQNLVQQGIPQNEAANIVDGVTDIEIVPETGRARLINRATEEVREIPISGEQEENRAEVPENQTLFDLSDDASGLRSSALAATARIPGTEVTEAERKVLNARTQFRTFENELARGLVNNPRFPVAERTAVLESVDVSPAILDTPSALRVRLGSTKNFLDTKLQQAERDANDASLPEEHRSAQAQNAAVLRNAIDRIGDPQTGMGEDIGNLSRDEARTLIQDMSEQELDALPEAERQALADKLK